MIRKRVEERDDKMHICKKIRGLFFTGILVLCAIGYSQADQSNVAQDFKNNMIRKIIKDVSIEMPNYFNLEQEVSGGAGGERLFQDISKTKVIIVSTKPYWAELTDDVKRVAPNPYEFLRMVYSPGINPIAILLKRAWGAGYDKIEYMKLIDFSNFQGFVTKGIRNSKQPGKQPAYDMAYQLFNKEKNKYIEVVIMGKQNYAFSDDESNYIISTVKGL